MLSNKHLAVTAALVFSLYVALEAAAQTHGQFSFQGRLLRNGQPVSQNCDFIFTVYDARVGGNALAPGSEFLNRPVRLGYFDIPSLPIPAPATGQTMWLETRVRCPSNTGSYATLTPRQEIFAAPMALTLRPGAVISGAIPNGASLVVANNFTGTANFVQGVRGESTSVHGRGVVGIAHATSGETIGVVGRAFSPSGRGVFGDNRSTSGNPAAGVYGLTASRNGAGVYGVAESTVLSNSFGVVGLAYSPVGIGVYGRVMTRTGQSYSIYGYNDSPQGWAGWFQGRVHVNGTLSKSSGAFLIDHPLDPANKYLAHSFVESSEMLNIYSGVVDLDQNGEATVTLPAWFEALNKDYRYQLTAIGAPMPNLHIAQPIQNNSFKIAGGVPNKQVSWTVMGVRNDPYARRYPIVVEQDKPLHERGRYLHPELYVTESLGIASANNNLGLGVVEPPLDSNPSRE